MAINEQEVRHVAALSKLAFSEEAVTAYTATLGKIIDMVEMLDEVDTTGVAFTSNVADTLNYMREDEAAPGWDRQALLANVPETSDGFIKVPAMLEDKA